MKDWIEKILDPPGMERKNRRSLFSFIARVFGTVKDDAAKAHNAFFPYLCDPDKLREHGRALMIPELPFDTEDGYRNRVTTASFYLMKAGERAFIHEQLKAHFGDSYLLKEEFLQVFLNIRDINEGNLAWAYSFLDGILDPNIFLKIEEWYRFIETMTMQEELNIRAKLKTHIDSFDGDFFCNGRFYCDQAKNILCDDTWPCDGSMNCNYTIPIIGTISDYFLEEVNANGRYACNGEFDCSGYNEIFSPVEVTEPILLNDSINETFNTLLHIEPMEDQMKIEAFCDGSFLCDGSNNDSIADGPMALRIIKPLRCDGSKMPFAKVCDGSIICDGTYSDADGLYYSGDVIISQEVL